MEYVGAYLKETELSLAMRLLWDNGYRVFTRDGAEIIDQRKNKDTPND